VFDIKSLQFNISHHELVPKHEVIHDEAEVKDIVAKYSLKSKFQLPIILKTDAMAKYLGLKNGDVVKITRVSPTAGEYIVYRCCV
jgi:DNA-directed RNA polymerase I, II, and III subunit RPABC1